MRRLVRPCVGVGSKAYWCPRGCGKRVRFEIDRDDTGAYWWRCLACRTVFVRPPVLR